MFRSAAVLLIALGLTATAHAKDETVKGPFKEGSPEWVIATALKAAVAGDFNAYLTVIHPEHKSTRDQKSQRERYEWKRFKKQHRWYIVKDKPMTFVITQRREEGTNYKRIFLRDQKNKGRMPVPLRLKKSGDRWYIVTSSL